MKIYHKVEPPTRITRARAAASNASMGVLPPKPPTKTLRATSKRLASDENSASSSVTAGIHCKRRAVLKDVTNICCENLYKGCISAAKVQTKNFKQEKRLPVKNGPKVVADLAARTLSVEEDACHMRPNELEKKGYTQSQVVTLPVKLGRNASIKRNMESTKSKCAVALPQLEELVSRKPSQHIRFSIEEKGKHCKSSEYEVGVINIDSDQKNPQMCSLYAPEIYRNLRVKEVHFTIHVFACD
ncbi:hypothetical protein IFM89_004231 [Coptis chinensis]|uniref:Uncharacterized protein n=1 Tax=Coptis chinensis TaxID=261450 RepID=A0A835M6T4_9MAGN|nr:hypothetical protein IFM89_004231 [Coptis chinensis]